MYSMEIGRNVLSKWLDSETDDWYELYEFEGKEKREGLIVSFMLQGQGEKYLKPRVFY